MGRIEMDGGVGGLGGIGHGERHKSWHVNE